MNIASAQYYIIKSHMWIGIKLHNTFVNTVGVELRYKCMEENSRENRSSVQLSNTRVTRYSVDSLLFLRLFIKRIVFWLIAREILNIFSNCQNFE